VSTGEQILRILHFLSLFLMTAGLGAVMVPLWRGWREEDTASQVSAFEDATTGHKAALLPGTRRWCHQLRQPRPSTTSSPRAGCSR
jgi:hypothetical protein